MVTPASAKVNYTYFFHRYHNYSMFRDVPEYSMFLVLSTDMQISFEMSDSYVNTLNMADFNLILRAIQGDIN